MGKLPPEKPSAAVSCAGLLQIIRRQRCRSCLGARSRWVGPVRLAAFISVSRRQVRTPMNNPLRSSRVEKTRWREAGFDEGCL
ncbi:unnamed protein product [Mycetohabitans rhizoxinica HKI 454]|uniref:Uncharacterized protein n=1 Tax=Mycetohabitans rhizoxinica (strain DSM 19002 / CIP 109453 / HKI 454) TaxID=882378 RepID=E5AM02_MYCRK|nr:unnamed protein product [Mycetohabitans rhizoxinica HKI 454]